MLHEEITSDIIGSAVVVLNEWKSWLDEKVSQCLPLNLFKQKRNGTADYTDIADKE